MCSAPALWQQPERRLIITIMRNRLTGPERWIVALLAAIAAFTFFLPLFSIQVPFVGDQEVTGYDTASKIRKLTRDLRSASGHDREGKPSIKLPKIPRNDSAQAPAIPVSIRFSWLIPVFIIGAFGCAVLTLLGSLLSLRISKIASTVGTFCGVLALVHLTAMNSDMHSLLEATIRQGTGDRQGNPLAGFMQAVGSALINTLTLKPGAGLYVLAISLGIAAFLAHSRFLSRFQFTVRAS